MAKTSAEIADSMKATIRNSYPQLDISEGEIINDVVIMAPAIELATMSEDIETISNAQSILTANDAALERIANNIGLLRKSARVSLGVVYFYRTTIPSSNVVIPAGTKVSTLASDGAAGVQFVTLQEATLYYLQANLYYNATNNRYEIPVNVQSLQAGSDSNVGAGTITEMLSSVTGIDGCVNYSPSSGGGDIESSADLLTRIQAKWLGTSLGTKNGILTTVLSDDAVVDAVIVANSATGRDEYGVVDIYVKGERLIGQLDIFTSYDVTLPEFVLMKQPVEDRGISYISSSLMGVLSPAQYTLTLDTGAYAGSIYGFDRIVWTDPMPTSTYGTVSVSYLYNSLIEDLQNLFLQSSNDLVNTSVVVKASKKIPIDLSVNIVIKSGLGFDSATVQTNVQDALAIYFSTLGIGKEVQQADVALAILSVPGVDDLQIPFATFQSSDGTITKNTNNNLVLPLYSYGAAGTVIVNVV